MKALPPHPCPQRKPLSVAERGRCVPEGTSGKAARAQWGSGRASRPTGLSNLLAGCPPTLLCRCRDSCSAPLPVSLLED